MALEQNKGRAAIAGLVTALKNALSKLSIAIPMLIAFPVLGALGLTEGSETIAAVTEPIQTLNRWAVIGFYAGIPLLLKLTAFVLMGRLFPTATAR